AFFATARALEASRRSDEIKSARPPALRISSTVFLPRSTLRPTTKTWMPSCASLLATARPMPLVPPVISAVESICSSPCRFYCPKLPLGGHLVTSKQGGSGPCELYPCVFFLLRRCGSNPCVYFSNTSTINC